ncbi:MAG: hypothetical protein ABIH82_03690 [Candidatus Woesearchaeota archaeon]
MNRNVKNYLNSFNPNKNHLMSIIVDVVLFALLFSSFTFFLNYTQDTVNGLNTITHPDYVQEKLATMNAEEMQAFVLEMRSFLYVFVGGAIFLFLLTLFLFSISRDLLWKHLLKKKFAWKTYPKWIGLTFFSMLLLVIYLLLALVLKLLLTYILTRFTTNSSVLSIFNNSITVGFFILFMLFLFLVFYNLTDSNKVFISIGKAFGQMRTKFWILFLLAWATAHVPMLIAIPFQNSLQFNTSLLKILSITITLIYITWLRLYLFKIIEHEA